MRKNQENNTFNKAQRPLKRKKRKMAKVSEVDLDSFSAMIFSLFPNFIGKGEKQYSVLELLELQARARAIRSQLALEPVTKIELDDSDEEAQAVKKDSQPKTFNSAKSNEKLDQPSSSNHVSVNVTPQIEEEKSKLPASRPVRLKRNFRRRQEDETNEAQGEKATTNEENSEETSAESKAEEATEEKIEENENEKQDESSVPTANDVDDEIIPIIPEPEILCISSSDSEDDGKQSKKTKTIKNYITMPIIEKEDRPLTEDELFLLKVKEKSTQEIPKSRDLRMTELLKKPSSEAKQGENDEPPEDGEILDDEAGAATATRPPANKIGEKCAEIDVMDITEDTQSDNGNDEPSKENEDTIESVDAEHSRSPSKEKETSNDDESDSDRSENESKNEDKTEKKSPEEDDDDEDIIDLDKDEDLDFEIKDSPEVEPAETISASKRQKKRRQEKSTEDSDSKVKFKFLDSNVFDLIHILINRTNHGAHDG